MSLFKAVPKNVKLKNQHKCISEDDIILYKNCDLSNVEIWFLDEKPNNGKLIPFLKRKLAKKYPKLNYAILSSSIIEIIPEDEKQFVELYTKHKSSFANFIPKKSKIITLGRAIYAVTESDDLLPHYFYDQISAIYKFYDKRLDCYVWPVDSLDSFLAKDNWENDFFKDQLKRCIEFIYRREKKKEPILKYVEDPNTFLELYSSNSAYPKVAWDLETSGLHFAKNKIGCLTLSFDGVHGYFLPWDLIDVEILSEFFKGKFQIGNNLGFDCKFLKNVEVKNVKVDFDNLHAGHIINEMRSNSLKTHAWLYTKHGGYDEELEHYKKKYKIKNYLDIPFDVLYYYATMDAIVAFQTYEKQEKQIEEIDVQYPMDNGWSLHKYYYEIMIPTINMYVDIELAGMHINIQVLREKGELLKKQIKDLEIEIQTAWNVSKDFNIRSTEQLGKLLEERGLPEFGRAKKGHYLTGDKPLTEWKKLGYKEANYILKYREINKLFDTYVGDEKEGTGLWQYIVKYGEKDYRIHSNYAVMLANSGRNKSYNPNCQNFPSHGDKAKLVRSFIDVPDEYYNFLSVDYSGLQLRLTGMVSDDPEMRKAFIELGGDIHSITGYNVIAQKKVPFLQIVFEDNTEKIIRPFDKYNNVEVKDLEVGQFNIKAIIPIKQEVLLEEFIKYKGDDDVGGLRYKAKSFNFGLIFGATAFTIMTQNIIPNWSLEECKKFVEDNNIELLDYQRKSNYYFTVAEYTRKQFFLLYNVLEKNLEFRIRNAKKNRYVRSVYGAFRRFPQLTIRERFNEDYKTLSSKENISLNTDIQNMESVIVNRSMLQIYEWLQENNMKSYFMGQIHDAMELYIHIDEIEIVCKKIKQIAEKEYSEYNDIPLEVEGNIADYRHKNELWDMGHNWKIYLKEENNE